MTYFMILGKYQFQVSKDFCADESSNCNKDLLESIFPHARVFLIVSNFLRIPLVVASYWKPGLCRYYLYMMLLHNMVKETLPIDYGQMHIRHLMLVNVIIFILYGYDWTKSIVSLILYNFYTMVVVRSLIYQEDELVSLVFQFLASTIVTAYFCAVVYVMQSWIGFQYIAAELPHESNKRLLNNFQEGVFIVSEDTKETLFQNSAAVRIKTSLESECEVMGPVTST